MAAGLLAAPLAARADLGLRSTPAEPRLGDLLILSFDADLAGVDRVPAALFDQHFDFLRVGARRFRGLVPVPMDIQARAHELEIALPSRTEVHSISVVDRPWQSSELKVSRRFTEAPTGARAARIRRERAQWNDAFLERATTPKHQGPFIRPVDGPVTAVFGTKRIFNGALASRHYGLDLNGRTGTPVNALGGGTVVMDSMRFSTGGTLMIDHGGGLFSAYFHLSRRDKVVGEVVSAGERIGLVGKSGRVTGPHLHLAVIVRVDGLVDGTLRPRHLYVDPEPVLGLILDGDPSAAAGR